MASTLGFEPGLHWWGRSGPITTALPLHAPLTGSLRRPADQQARRLWVRDWVEQRKKSASEAVD